MAAANLTQAIFFDLGYTLINFEGDYQRVTQASYLALADELIRSVLKLDAPVFITRFNETISAYYQSRDADLIERPVEIYLSRVLQAFGYTDTPEEVINQALTAMYRLTEGNWRLEDDAIPVLQQLKEYGCRLGMISNAANGENFNRLIDRFELRNFFDAIFVSAVEQVRKPDSRIYSRALKALGVEGSNSLMVGDTLTADILGAQNSGLRAIWITTRENHPDNLSMRDRITPDAVIRRLTELPDTLRRLE